MERISAVICTKNEAHNIAACIESVRGVAAQTGGEATHALVTNEMPVHTHTYTVTPGTGAAAVGTQGGSGTPVYGTVATDARGGGYSHTNVQPSLVVNAIIGI